MYLDIENGKFSGKLLREIDCTSVTNQKFFIQTLSNSCLFYPQTLSRERILLISLTLEQNKIFK